MKFKTSVYLIMWLFVIIEAIMPLTKIEYDSTTLFLLIIKWGVVSIATTLYFDKEEEA